MFRVFMASYLLFRLLVDFLKPDPPALAGGLTAIQYASVAGIAYYLWGATRRGMQRAAETA